MDYSSFIKNAYSDLIDKISKNIENSQSLSLCLRSDDLFLADKFSQILLEKIEEIPISNIINSNDYYSINGEEIIKINEIRNAEEFVFLNKDKLKKKYLFIERIERTNNVSENALLKMLEEPPKDTIILSTSKSYRSLLPTIRSRLTKFEIPIRKIKEDDLLNWKDRFVWLSNNSFDVFINLYALNGDEQDELIQIFQKMTITQLNEEYINICAKKFNDWNSSYIFNENTWKSIYSSFFAEKLLMTVEKNKNIDLYLELFGQTERISRIYGYTKFYTSWLKGFSKYIILLLEDYLNFCYLEERSNIAYTDINLFWINRERKLNLEAIRELLEFLDKICNFEIFTLNNTLTFYLIIEKIKNIY